MTALSPEAYAVIEGRHSDPFHYLGLHVEGDVPVVRVFLPDAEEVKVVDEQGHESDLSRVHDAGLFVGRLANGSPRYRVRARYGDREVEMEDPYRFPPMLSDFDLYLLGEGTHTQSLREARRASDGARRRRRRGVRGFRPQCPARQRGRRLQFLGRPSPCHARARQRLLGNLRSRRKAGDKYKYEIIGSHGQLLPLKSDPVAFAAEVRPRTASIVVDLETVERPAPLAAGVNALSAPISIYEVHLGSWRRRPEEGGRWLSYRELAEATARLRARPRLHPCRIPAGHRAPVRRLVGLPADRPVRADQPLRHARRFRRAGRCLPSRRPRGHARLGARDISPTIRTGSGSSTEPRSTSTPIRGRAVTSTGTR